MLIRKLPAKLAWLMEAAKAARNQSTRSCLLPAIKITCMSFKSFSILCSVLVIIFHINVSKYALVKRSVGIKSLHEGPMQLQSAATSRYRKFLSAGCPSLPGS